jgi:hypothetical protein
MSVIWGDCVAKVESCWATNFRKNPEPEAIADSYNLEVNLQPQPTSTARLKWGQRRGAIDRNRAEPAACRQVPLPTPPSALVTCVA